MDLSNNNNLQKQQHESKNECRLSSSKRSAEIY